MRQKKSVLLILCAVVIFAACANDPLSPPDPPRGPTTVERTLAESDNIFGLKLFREINKQAVDENVFISPLSVALALGMTLNGANGETKQAMEQALELAGMTTAEINAAYQSLIELLTGLDPAVQFQIANSIWYRQEFDVEDEFIELNQTYFNAEVAALDFNDPGAPGIINAWVEQNTNGKIDKIVEVINPATVMFLINAIYFKGAWTYEFDPELTHDAPFSTPEGDQTCQMMTQEDEFRYFQNEEFQAVDLPYGNGHYSMTIFLPRESVSLESFIAELTAEHWQAWMDSFVEIEGVLYLPKFKLEYEQTLNDALSALGMGVAFNRANADFTGINRDGNLFISQVKHKTFVEVNEQGTEAAAVTSVEIEVTSVPDKFEMRLDRPFMFVIRDHHVGTQLFLGKIVKPTWE